MLILLKRKNEGLYIMISGLAIYITFGIIASQTSYDYNRLIHPQHWLVGYWFVHRPILNEFGCYSCYLADVTTFYYIFLPSIFSMIILASIGWLKTRNEN